LSASRLALRGFLRRVSIDPGLVDLAIGACLGGEATAAADDTLLVEGKAWTGFANSEEQYVDEYVGQKVQPFWIEEEAKKLANTNFIVNSRFKPHAVRDGNLITGQQQYSGAAAAALMIEALGQ
jgi:putative intracellular protease/amidase